MSEKLSSFRRKKSYLGPCMRGGRTTPKTVPFACDLGSGSEGEETGHGRDVNHATRVKGGRIFGEEGSKADNATSGETWGKRKIRETHAAVTRSGRWVSPHMLI